MDNNDESTPHNTNDTSRSRDDTVAYDLYLTFIILFTH